jgi:hypothetical protein
MRALATPARRRSPRGGACDEPPRLWGDPAAVAVPAPEAALATAPVAAPEATLEDLVCGTWDELVSGAAVACPVCMEPMTPRWSAGAGVVGGRCGSCAATLE